MSTRPATADKPTSKIDSVIALLARAEGASLTDITSATSWPSHTARAVITGLKKKGHTITRERSDGVSHYRLTNPNAS